MRATGSFRRRVAAAALFAGVALLVPAAGGQPPAGGGKGVKARGAVKAGVHKVSLTAGTLYQIRVTGAGFAPAVQIRPGFLGSNTGEPAALGDTFEAFYLARETRDHRLVVTPAVDDDELAGDLLEYDLEVVPVVLARDPVLEVSDKLSAADPPYLTADPGGFGVNRGPHKAYELNLKADQVYVITVDVPATNPGGFDPYLHVEGPKNPRTQERKILAFDDDGGGYPNSRVVLHVRPNRGGDHRLIVTGVGKTTGAYTLTVRTTAGGLPARGAVKE